MIVIRGLSSGISDLEIIKVFPVSMGGFPVSEELMSTVSVPQS